MSTRIDGREVVLDATLVTSVSLAVRLVDSYTSVTRRNGQESVLSRPVIGRVLVIIKELAREGRLNPSGYFLFLNLPDGIYTLRIESDNYQDQEILLSLPTSLPDNPLVDIFLQPKPSYPFPPGATLITGLVRDPSGKPVAAANVEIVGKSIESRTSEKGEFVLYFNFLKEADVIVVNNKRFVKGNGDQTLTVRASHPQFGPIETTTEAQEGTTTSVLLDY